MVGWMSNSPTSESRDPPFLIREGFSMDTSLHIYIYIYIYTYIYIYIYTHYILIPHEFEVVYVQKNPGNLHVTTERHQQFFWKSHIPCGKLT